MWWFIITFKWININFLLLFLSVINIHRWIFIYIFRFFTIEEYSMKALYIIRLPKEHLIVELLVLRGMHIGNFGRKMPGHPGGDWVVLNSALPLQGIPGLIPDWKFYIRSEAQKRNCQTFPKWLYPIYISILPETVL